MAAPQALLVLGAAVLLGLPAGAQSVTGVETRITTNPSDQWAPSISGDIVSYTDFRGPDTDIYYFDLATRTEHPVSTAPGNQELPKTSEGLISYLDLDGRRALVFDTRTGVTVDATSGAGGTALDPTVGQALVAWADSRDGNLEIYARDLGTGEVRRVTDSPEADDMPAVDSGVIVWQRCRDTCDIWAYDWATGATRQITNTPDRDERLPDIWHSRVVFEALQGGDKDIYEVDLATGAERRLALPADQGHPTISGDFVAFDDLASGIYHIQLWHLPTDQVFPITGGASGQYLNDIDGNRVVYTDDRAGQLDIYLFEFQLTAPAALAADCEHLNGAAPLFDSTFEHESRRPEHFAAGFAAPAAGPGLLCIDNRAGGAPGVTSASLRLNGRTVVDPDDFSDRSDRDRGRKDEPRSQLERRVPLEASNSVAIDLRGRREAALRVRFFAAQSPPSPSPCWHGHGARRGKAELASGAAALAGVAEAPVPGSPEASSGCGQAGAGAAPWASAWIAALFAFARRARGRR